MFNLERKWSNKVEQTGSTLGLSAIQTTNTPTYAWYHTQAESHSISYHSRLQCQLSFFYVSHQMQHIVIDCITSYKVLYGWRKPLNVTLLWEKHESVRIWKCQNMKVSESLFSPNYKCYHATDMKVPESHFSQDMKVSELESVRIGKCQNWKK